MRDQYNGGCSMNRYFHALQLQRVTCNALAA